MRGPYGFEMNENCENCTARKAGFFCQLTPKASKSFDASKSVSVYPEGAVLFLEKQQSRGVFVVCEGEVKLTISSSEGKMLILRIAKPGEILGLMSVLSGSPYEVTAETLRPCQVAFIRQDDFLRFVAENSEALQAIVKQLSSNYHGACEQLRTVGLSASAPEKVAKLLLELATGAEETKAGIRIRLSLTHQEIAELIGISRETVTRTLSDFKNRHLVSISGSMLTISNRQALNSLVTI